MWSVLALGVAEKMVNRMVDLDALTRIQLNSLEGQRLRVIIDSPQLSVDVLFDAEKIRLEPTVTGHASTTSIFEQRSFDQKEHVVDATATLHVENIVALAKLLLNKEMGNIPVQGNYHLLQNIQNILQHMQPDIAAQLSPWIGANLSSALGQVHVVPKYLQRSIQSQMFFLEDTIKEDSKLFAARWEMDDLNKGTRQLQQNIDRLDAKIKLLKAKLPLNHSGD
ncbi:ubiquinone biosynthesis accessory factor UbiJ [Acinetobacter nectaris]|uniref:ubiquinone biosynthesis accessory factor UbiJ n=1 Tax=Acinetobacter nectaris TaxID=1219382 RepID=UPI001F2246C2|nr:hypothetical protein [Acinetobacter nectaris]MCF9033503.1 hypothetical protein [Acinetobacter nectaris]